ncbi:tRNA glutamyl-Q(34) synthetase GluQRS [Sedimentitalea todarodis]|uniref:tRNA glutamyl-Q(34) synthetase GluQRS n=1 Tax=Sedimentitalea todarodis TaxID=1631240 RepID=A0ABU3VAY4_9RHOB|nr:tRNA glutamyl-Q(34) synthetase GluQRS [Sedimentitalea todarodis]MDU9003337.1 tRNA glutamyl-Q(34) synthetase GluQRS [Sedimentitalea todarodis]
MNFITRFAPSPTGPLHLGHAYSAFLAHDMATARGGQFLLRIEDIDQSRSRPEWETAIYDDLHWLGLNWPSPVLRQSERGEAYTDALNQLWAWGLLYPCTCSRRDIETAASAPQEGAPIHGPDGLIYPGTCRPQTPDTTLPYPKNSALRLDISRALAAVAQNPLHFTETGAGSDGEHGAIHIPGTDLLTTVGDVVLLRRDMGTSYHLSVVLDDAAQRITHVVRGQDLFEATQIHVLLQHLLDLPTPVYHHHRLIRDAAGKRLAKRDDARAISKFRAEGATPADIRAMVGLRATLAPSSLQ